MTRARDQQKQNDDTARNHDARSKMHFARRARINGGDPLRTVT
jgi:hypothetical protein